LLSAGISVPDIFITHNRRFMQGLSSSKKPNIDIFKNNSISIDIMSIDRTGILIEAKAKHIPPLQPKLQRWALVRLLNKLNIGKVLL
jgi:hypothetical protein